MLNSTQSLMPMPLLNSMKEKLMEDNLRSIFQPKDPIPLSKKPPKLKIPKEETENPDNKEEENLPKKSSKRKKDNWNPELKYPEKNPPLSSLET